MVLRLVVGPWTGDAGIAEVTELDSFSVTFNLSAEGCNLAFSTKGDSEAAAVMDEMATDVWMYVNNVLVQRNRITQINQDWNADGDDVINVQSYCYRAMMRRRHLSRPYTFTNMDQGEIAWRLYLDAQLQPGGWLDVTPGTLDSTVQRDRSYEAGANIGELLENLSQVINGPRVNVTPAHVFNAVHPSSAYPTQAQPIVHGATARTLQRQSGADLFANAVRGTGDANATTPVVAINSTLLSSFDIPAVAHEGVTAPDNAAFPDSNGDWSLVVKVDITQMPDAAGYLALKDSGTTSYREWIFYVNSSGDLAFSAYNSAGTPDNFVASGVMSVGEWLLGITWDDTNSVQRAWYSDDDGVTWTQLGSDNAVSGTWHTSDGDLCMGGGPQSTSPACEGTYEFMRLYDGLGGSIWPGQGELVAHVQGDLMGTGTAKTGDDVFGNTWTATTSVDVNHVAESRGRWDVGVAWSSVTDQDTLVEHTDGELEDRNTPEATWVAEIEPSRWLDDLPLRAGDLCTLVVPRSTVAPVGTPTTEVDVQCVELAVDFTADGELTVRGSFVELQA